jgi:hypothetical protein
MPRVELSLDTYKRKSNSFEDLYMYGNSYSLESRIVDLIESFKDDKKSEYGELLKRLNKPGMHNVDTLCVILREEVTLPFEFAKNLNLYDVLNPKCLRPLTPAATDLIKIICEMEIYSIVTMKQYEDIDKLFFDMYVCHYDYVRDLKEDLIDAK